MSSYKNIVTFAIIAFVVALVIHLLFNVNRAGTYGTHEEHFDSSEPPELNKTLNIPMNADKVVINPNAFPTYMDHGCPNRQNEIDHENYLTHTLLDKQFMCPPTNVSNVNTCPKSCKDKPESTKKFHHDFFKFRDYTYLNSSMHEDPVDKVIDLYLTGNLSQARNYPSKKIKDIFDDSARSVNLYERQCVRLPYFDNINPDGWYSNYGTPGTELTRNDWEYDKNKLTGISYNDPYESNYQNLSVYGKNN